MVEKLNSKYQVALAKYLEKCNQYKKLKEECDIICMSNDEQQTKISSLEEELSLRVTELNSLNSTYVEHVNTSLLQYQTISVKLENSQTIVKEQEKRIALLEETAKSGKKQCRSCGKVMRSTRQQKPNLEEVSESDTTNTKSETVSYSCHINCFITNV